PARDMGICSVDDLCHQRYDPLGYSPTTLFFLSKSWSTCVAGSTWAVTPVLIRYHFDYESVQIWPSEALEMSRHDPSVRRPCQECVATTRHESGPRRVAPAQAEAGASSYAAWQNCRRLERGPRAVSSECDPYRNSSSCAPEAPKHAAE